MNNLNQRLSIRKFGNAITSVVIFSCMYCMGQDTIVKRDGRVLIGYVTEILPEQVRYKKNSPTEGPTYIESKVEVDRVKFSNGFTDVFPEQKPWQVSVATVEQAKLIEKIRLEKRGAMYLYGSRFINDNQLYRNLLTFDNPEITKEIKKAKRARVGQYTGFVGIPLMVLAVYGLGTGFLFEDLEPGKPNNGYTTFGTIMLGGAALALSTSICFKFKRKHHNNEAVKLYQQQYE